MRKDWKVNFCRKKWKPILNWSWKKKIVSTNYNKLKKSSKKLRSKLKRLRKDWTYWCLNRSCWMSSMKISIRFTRRKCRTTWKGNTKRSSLTPISNNCRSSANSEKNKKPNFLFNSPSFGRNDNKLKVKSIVWYLRETISSQNSRNWNRN
jgi:hypothetical protein